MSVNFGEAELPAAPPVVIEIEVPAEFDIESWSAGLVVPIPTLPLSNTDKEGEAFEFSTKNAVVADVEPLPFTCRRDHGVVLALPTLPPVVIFKRSVWLFLIEKRLLVGYFKIVH